MSTSLLPRICLGAADLARGRQVLLDHDECEALRDFQRIGLLHMQEPELDRQPVLCTCRHPRLFAFHFYYRWLPTNIGNFRPSRRDPAQS
ncbi:hypothetical protein JVX91_24210 [Pseudomonas sp. PDNC002]|uniref:hypothetical protein n=1 Tax=Pseudomonas sp. PDNC002 TaxID=2811422 RepID=UPI001963C512|nr:hypothetical protein [Pseudomonas sp. PDNC002]QRY78655.1 hypothetical protein JVX91_24210 [Pseudomonas sp. PDNC002]